MTETEQAICAPDTMRLSPEDETRAHMYRLLARFLGEIPTQSDLDVAAALKGDDSELGKALSTLATVAAKTGVSAADDEYHDLFIGMARGELLPFGSYYLTGFLNEKPLAKLRRDMAKLGIAANPDTKDPEDHIASILDMSAGLILGEYSLSGRFASLEAQKKFFEEHLGSWAPHFFRDLEGAKNSVLYAPIGTIGRLFMQIEEAAFEMVASDE